ncbi:TPA: hypothetical protein RMI67_005136 [Bacillus cereus]|nr:hypothetical protein [Bacillus cereus]
MESNVNINVNINGCEQTDNNGNGNLGRFPRNIIIDNETTYTAIDIDLVTHDGTIRFANYLVPEETSIQTYSQGVLIYEVHAKLRVRQPDGSFRNITALPYENADPSRIFPSHFSIQEISDNYFAVVQEDVPTINS